MPDHNRHVIDSPVQIRGDVEAIIDLAVGKILVLIGIHELTVQKQGIIGVGGNPQLRLAPFPIKLPVAVRSRILLKPNPYWFQSFILRYAVFLIVA